MNTSRTPPALSLSLAIVGAGPVGLALALLASQALPDAQVTLFDARAEDKDVSGDPRTLALSLGSVQLLQRLGAWRAEQAQPILEVHVSQQPPTVGALLGSWLGSSATTRKKVVDRMTHQLFKGKSFAYALVRA